MGFFTADTVAFLRGLEADNSKVWFDAHRSDYELHVKEPYLALAAALIDRVNAEEPEYEMEPKQAVYRINRDTRFARDKSPYKTELGITVGRDEKHDSTWPAYTCRVSAHGVWVAGGLYRPDTALRDAVRRYVGEHADELRRLERGSTRFAKTFGALQGDAHKRAPSELKELAEVEPRVRNTQWIFWAEFADESLLADPKLDRFIAERWAAARPVQAFLKDAVSSAG